MKKIKYITTSSKVNRKILLFLCALLCITLLRSQILPHRNLAFDSNPAVPGQRQAGAGRRTGNTQSSSQQLFSSAAGRVKVTGLQLANKQRQYAVGYTLSHSNLRNGRWFTPATGQAELDWLDELIEKIWFVESTNRLNPPDGDDGNAAGPLQIHQGVLDDVNKRYGTNFVREDLRKPETAKTVARLYISMWMESHKEEIAARIFNGGPRGWRKKSTDTYWEKIKVRIAGESK